MPTLNSTKAGWLTLPRLSSKPREWEYDLSHTFALDIFFQKTERLPFSTLEKSPIVFSLAEGIVVAATASWRGGEDLASYHSGGITPKAGNGGHYLFPGKEKILPLLSSLRRLCFPGGDNSQRAAAGPWRQYGDKRTQARPRRTFASGNLRRAQWPFPPQP